MEKFKTGNCSPEEVRKILLWYQSEEAEASSSMEVETYWNEHKEFAFTDKEEVFNRIHEKIGSGDGGAMRSKKQHHRSPVSRKGSNVNGLAKWIVIAMLLLLPIVSLLYYGPQLFPPEQVETANRMMRRETILGQKYTMRLSDGTVVKLNSGSTIQYPERFTDEKRVVEFQGEAFFEVAKDNSKPFVIKSGNISTTVLGTSFNLKTMPDTEKFEVAVVTGSVKVSHFRDAYSNDERYLSPNQSAVFDGEHDTFNVQAFDPQIVLAWTNGNIIFKNSTFEEIIFRLESWYGVEIDTASLKRNITKGYTGSYKDKSLETVLDGISFVLEFQYEIEDKKVMIK